jgi:recombination protein RecR
MYQSSESLGKLVTLLSRLPGIGRKTAGRLAFHILKMSPDEARELAETILVVKEKVGTCATCCNISETDPCAVCSSQTRDRSIICVVEEASDIIALEKAEDFTPLYHVLGGRLSPLDGIGPDDLNIKALLSRLDGTVKEVVIATNPDVEGEATAMYLKKLISPFGPKVTRIARGLPVGGDLEYADGVTITRALQGRTEIK